MKKIKVLLLSAGLVALMLIPRGSEARNSTAGTIHHRMCHGNPVRLSDRPIRHRHAVRAVRWHRHEARLIRRHG